MVGPARASDGVLLERGGELERIGSVVQRARAGHGSALVIEGPAGIGKAALLAAARQTAESAGFSVLRARDAELERDDLPKMVISAGPVTSWPYRDGHRAAKSCSCGR